MLRMAYENAEFKVYFGDSWNGGIDGFGSSVLGRAIKGSSLL